MFRHVALVAALVVSVATASASTLTRPQVIQAVTSLEICMRTMCLPSGDPSMSLGAASDLRRKLAQQPNALDQWTIARLDPVIVLLGQKKIQLALDQTQTLVGALVRPDVLKLLQDLESCVRTMCLPAGDGSMGILGAKAVLRVVGASAGPLGRWVTQRVNAIILLLQQKKIREGLDQIQSTIKELPAL